MGYKNTDIKFINPYNFVRVDWKNTPRKPVADYYGEDKISGYFDCELITKTPLAIPELKEREANGHGVYSFFRDPVDNIPMIPGSSIRGCVRTVYETASDSCLVTADENYIFTKRAGMTEAGKPGLLIYEGGKWVLYSAKRYLIIIQDPQYVAFNLPEFKEAQRISRNELESNYKYGQKVSFSALTEYVSKKKSREISVGVVVNRFSANEDLGKEGYLYIGEPLPGKKHFESIFEKESRQNITVTDDDIEGLKLIFSMYNDPAVNRNIEDKGDCYKGFDNLLEKEKNGTVIPVWYESNNHKFSLASVGRIVYERKMDHFLGAKKPCNDRSSLCKACALFGMSNNESIGSHVRITDAKLACGQYEGTFVTLKELGGPRPSYMPFYATGKDKASIKSYDDDGISLRGRKYYWHNSQDESYIEKTKTKRNSTMELVEKGKTFGFRVYFDDISREQYEELKWTLSLGDNKADSDLCYKIGHGKPIGLGSAKITITKEYLRSLNPYGISENETVDISNPFNITENSELLTIMNIRSTEGNTVSYPFITNPGAGKKENDTASHKWFSDNWDTNSKQTSGKIDQTLPSILNANTALLKAKEFVDDGSGGNYGKTSYRQDLSYEEGKTYTGVVTGYNPKGIFAYVKLDNGGRADFYDAEKNYDGCRVEVRYGGKRPDKNGIERDKWYPVGKA